jgi:two-component system NtrC family sensor kinase
MRRGAKPAKAKAKAARPVVRKPQKTENSRTRELEKRLAEALEQQAATSEILRVIASSRTDLQPVFAAILEHAVGLCGAQQALLWLYEGGEQFRLGAAHGARLDYREWLIEKPHHFGRPFFRPNGPWRVGHIEDVRETDPYRSGDPLWVRTADQEGMRTLLGVPLVKDGRLIGSIAVYRREVQRFTDAHVELIKTFADQAAIAIENVRLFKELEARNSDLTEALEQQTATAEILRVISSSPTDLQPVLDTVVRSAARFCGAYDAALFRLDGAAQRLAAHHGPLHVPFGLLIPVVRGTVGGRSVLERRAVHVADLQAAAEEFPEGSAFARDLGHRTILAVPMLREGEPIGSIQLRRFEVSPFTDKQIALLQTFADQAVIAIENVRLFKELQARNRDLTEALEQQTATSEILRVISSSPTDIQPVLGAISESAARLCEADLASVFRFDGTLIHFAAQYGRTAEEIEAARRAFPQPPHRGSVTGRALLAGSVVQIPDVAEDPEVEDALRIFRTVMSVPMIRDGQPLGAVTVARRVVRPFTDGQVALLQTFADQAVIAVENVRLFKELEARNAELTEALEQQTATAEVLRVISSSPTDLQPVFDAIVQSARRLLSGHGAALSRVVGDMLELAAFTVQGEVDDTLMRQDYPRPIAGHAGSNSRAVRERAPAFIVDIETEPGLPPQTREAIRRRGFRSVISVPLLRDAEAIGAISVTRSDPGTFGAEPRSHRSA